MGLKSCKSRTANDTHYQWALHVLCIVPTSVHAARVLEIALSHSTIYLHEFFVDATVQPFAN